MKLTTEIIDYIEDIRMDDDVRQELYVKLLEYEGEPIEYWTTWIARTVENIICNEQIKDQRRKELEADAVATLEGLVGSDENRDPLEYMEYELILSMMDGDLTDLMKDHLSDLLEGKTPEEMATEQGVSPNTIYQRTWQIKQALMEKVNGRR